MQGIPLPKLAESYYYLASLYWEKSEEYDKIEKLLLKALEYYENYSGRKQNMWLICGGAMVCLQLCLRLAG